MGVSLDNAAFARSGRPGFHCPRRGGLIAPLWRVNRKSPVPAILGQAM